MFLYSVKVLEILKCILAKQLKNADFSTSQYNINLTVSNDSSKTVLIYSTE